MPPKVEPRFVDANGLRFAYHTWGDPSHPLLLLFHGFPDTPHTWDFAGPRFAALGYQVVAPWMRGYAPTALPQKQTTTSRDLGEDALALMTALGRKTATLIGHDWGSEAVCAAVGLAPERVEKLVVVAIPHRTHLPLRPMTLFGARHMIGLQLPGALGRFVANDFAMVETYCKRWSPTWNVTAEELAPVKKCFAEPGAANAALGYYRGIVVITPPFMRGRVPVPTLAVAGEHDPAVTPADFEKARRQHSGRYEVAVIAGGHFCHRESPEPFVSAVTKFLQS